MKSIVISEVFLRPIITEDSLKDASLGRYTFEVSIEADKTVIKEAAKKVFNVDAQDVKTITYKPQPRRMLKTRQQPYGKKWKKAVLILKKGQKIDIFEVKEEKKEKK